jgi:hypothetical protein
VFFYGWGQLELKMRLMADEMQSMTAQVAELQAVVAQVKVECASERDAAVAAVSTMVGLRVELEAARDAELEATARANAARRRAESLSREMGRVKSEVESSKEQAAHAMAAATAAAADRQFLLDEIDEYKSSFEQSHVQQNQGQSLLTRRSSFSAASVVRPIDPLLVSLFFCVGKSF